MRMLAPEGTDDAGVNEEKGLSKFQASLSGKNFLTLNNSSGYAT